MLKILLVGSDHVWSLERFYIKYLQEEGLSVELFAAQNRFYEYNGRSILNKIKLRTGVSGIYRSINAELKAKVDQFHPDIIWVFKGMEVLPGTLGWIRAQGIRLVNYNPDNPFIFSGSGSGNKYVRDSIRLYDLHFTYNLGIQRQLEKEFHLSTALLPFGYELGEDLFLLNRKEPEILKACFLGNPDEHRAKIIRELALADIPIDVYGNDWSRFLDPHPSLRIFPAIYGDEFWKTLVQYRFQLNLMRIHNEDSHNMRTFEVPGAGGIMLAPATTEHRMFFKEGEEVVLFADVQECIRKAKQILALDKGESDRIRDRARLRSVNSGYTYKDRAQQALQQLKKLYA